MKTITLTDEQAGTLKMYLLITTQYRKREAEACIKLALERNDDGTHKYPKMPANATWWAETNETLDVICDLIRETPSTDIKTV